jgi:hypothetical protein
VVGAPTWLFSLAVFVAVIGAYFRPPPSTGSTGYGCSRSIADVDDRTFQAAH